MHRFKKRTGIFVGGGLIITVALALVAFGFFSQAYAQENTAQFSNIRGPGFGLGPRGEPGGDQQALADALGITSEQLQNAEQKASEAAIQQALDAGLITQDQADAMILQGRGFAFRFGGDRPGNPRADNSIDYDALLAKELGISTDQLQSARQTAQDDMLTQAVANGDITQEQADLIKARQALNSYIDPNALFAEALGITTDQLQSYRDQGLTISQILQKAGKTAIDVRDAQQAAYQAAIQKAVTDGVITQAQADQFLNGDFRGPGGFGGKGGGGFHGDFGGFEGRFKNAPNSGLESTPVAPGGGA
jgi:hypothetical protein